MGTTWRELIRGYQRVVLVVLLLFLVVYKNIILGQWILSRLVTLYNNLFRASRVIFKH